mmetsp:Transcript_37114/g.100166  ORF Transcript_37114/g.100166 Transcript_37114/m.100166 type:complete len:409 (-) Transcript_37114:25-1251(-)
MARMRGVVLKWAAALLLASLNCVNARCPGFGQSCSGHGNCTTDNVCQCDHEWNIEPDCSTKKCAKSESWSSRATGYNVGHSLAECGNRGTCDRDAGTCVCDAGFTGQACERLACPNDCSGKGECLTMYRAGRDLGPDTPAGFKPGGDGIGPIYKGWDDFSLMGCACDWGYTGSDCSLRMCPKGDDPLTENQYYRMINVTTNATAVSANLNGTFEVTFDGHSFEFPANASKWTARWTVEFVSWPSNPAQNNYFNHQGNPPLSSFTCDTTSARAMKFGKIVGNASCYFGDVQNSNIREYKDCSGRGICSTASGSCSCYSGFTGSNCETAATPLSTQTNADVLLLHAKSSDYSGNALHVKTSRSANAAFNLLYAESNGADTFTLKGSGDVVMAKGGLTITSGGQTITAGGR